MGSASAVCFGSPCSGLQRHSLWPGAVGRPGSGGSLFKVGLDEYDGLTLVVVGVVLGGGGVPVCLPRRPQA